MQILRSTPTLLAVLACSWLLTEGSALAEGPALVVGAGDPGQRVVLEATAFRVGGHLIQGDRGRLFVRENRQRADSPMIEIAFARFHHPNGGDAPPVVYLPGGPGQPVMASIQDFAATYRNYLAMGGDGDMILVEQRGIGASKPRLDCPGVLSRPADRPLSAAIMGSTHERYFERCIDHWVSQGVDVGGYNVVSMAEDVEELRARLGYERIKIYGESFGTHHALVYMQNHGDRVERAALSAVIGPDDMFEQPAQVERQLAGLERPAAGAGSAARDAEEDVEASLASMLTDLDPPIKVGVPTARGELPLEIGRYDLALATVTLSRQTAFMKELPRLYRTAAAGDVAWLGRWSASIRRGYQSNLAEMLITCASGASAGRRAEIKAQAAESPLGDAVDLLGADLCAPVAELELNGAFRRPIQADMPVLLISGELDPRAPPANAEAILPGLSQGRHVVFPGVSHDFGGARQGQLELAYRFLARGETEPDRTLMPAAAGGR